MQQCEHVVLHLEVKVPIVHLKFLVEMPRHLAQCILRYDLVCHK